MPYRKVYHHVRKHKKKYTRFIIFFVFLLAYGMIEDFTALTLSGVEFNVATFTLVFFVALIFTTIAEITEKLIEKKEPQKIVRFIKKEEKAIERNGKILKDKLKNEKKIIEKKLIKRK